MIALKEVKKILILGILIRLLIMPFYFHPDIKTYHFQASFLQKGVWDIYSYLSDHKSELPLKEEFVYFPLTYYFLGGYQILASPFLGEKFQSWLSDASGKALEQPETFRYLFILKLPYLILDILIAFLLTSFFTSLADKKKVFTFWLLNPFSIYLIYVFSNVDVVVVFLSVLGLLLAKQKRNYLSALLLGVGSAFKAYPLIFLPSLLVYTRGVVKKLLVLLLSIGSVGLITLPFLKDTGFREATLVSGFTTRIFIPKIPIGFNEELIIPLVIFSILIFWQILERNFSFDLLVKIYFGMLLIFFSLIHYHIQWLLWIMPFAVLITVRKIKLIPILLLLGLGFLTVPLLYDDKSMSVGVFSAINPLFNLLPSPFFVLDGLADPYLIQSVIHSVLAGGSALIILSLLREQTE